jgi:hypothetical protein
MGGRADVHAGFAKDNVLEMHECAVEVQRRARVGEMGSLGPPLGEGMGAEALIQTGEGLLGPLERPREAVPGEL